MIEAFHLKSGYGRLLSIFIRSEKYLRTAISNSWLLPIEVSSKA